MFMLRFYLLNGIFCVQFRLSLNNVGTVIAATYHYQKINRSKIKVPKKWPHVFQITFYWIFSWKMFSEASRTIYCIGFFLCNIVTGVLRLHGTEFFFCTMLSVACLTTSHRVLTCSILFQETTAHRIFSRAIMLTKYG